MSSFEHSHSFDHMSLRNQARENGISRNYDFYLNERARAKAETFIPACHLLSNMLLSVIKEKGADPGLPETARKSLIWFDLYSDIDGGDVVLSYVNRILADLSAEPVKRSDVLLRRMQHFRYNGWGGVQEWDFFVKNGYTDEEAAEILRLVDGCPTSLLGKATLLSKELSIFFDLWPRESRLGSAPAFPGLPRNNWLTGDRNARDEVETEFKFKLIGDVEAEFMASGEFRLPNLVSNYMARVRATDFHYESRPLEIRLRNVVENGLELTKDRVLDIILPHRLILRSSFFKDAVATGRELLEPWEKGADPILPQKDFAEISERVSQAVADHLRDPAQALATMAQLEREIGSLGLENQCLSYRIFVCEFYTSYGDLLLRSEDLPAALEKYSSAAELAEMMLNGSSEKRYERIGAICERISRVYSAAGDALNAEAYRKIAQYYFEASPETT